MNEENAKSGVKITPLAFLIRAVVASLKKFPRFNSSLDGDNLVVKQYWNIGFAADTPQGLMVPVIKNADQKGVAEIAKETSELAAKARDGKLGPAEMQGGTFSISSLGGIGGTAFTPIVNAPEVAILGVSKASMKPVWNGKERPAPHHAAIAFLRPPRDRLRPARDSPRTAQVIPTCAAASPRSLHGAIEIKVPDIGDFRTFPSSSCR